MEIFKYFQVILSMLLFVQALAVPVQNDQFCTGESMYKYEIGKTYMYDYSTETYLWINDVSDAAKSVLTLNTTVMIMPIEECRFVLKMKGSRLTGESLNPTDSTNVVNLLDGLYTVFRLNQQGELDNEIQFQQTDMQWSRNIKRAIISAFQLKSQTNLRELDHIDEQDERSATVYETDLLGRCRTTYKLDEQTPTMLRFNKVKSLHRCTLNENSKMSHAQYVPYKTIPEFFQGRLFIEDYECNTTVSNNLLNTVVCKEVSTFKIGSRGRLGVQAIVNQRLTYTGVVTGTVSVTDSLKTFSINYEYDNVNQNEIETVNFTPETYMQEICDTGVQQGLSNVHAQNFRDLVMTLRSYSSQTLVQLYEKSVSKCTFAGMTFSQALLFVDTENSFDAVLSLMDKNAFEDLKYISEYPLLTVLFRYQTPSQDLINRIRTYLVGKPQSFPYLNKLYLIYSSLIKTYCLQNQCSTSDLENWTTIFEANLVNDCSNSNNEDTIVATLQSIGNIGYFKNVDMLRKCAMIRENTIEIRVNAIESLRRFSCEKMENIDFIYSLLQETTDDTEIRINSFLTIMRCSDESERFTQFALEKLPTFLLNETDIQVLTYIIDYGKEHGLSTVLNTVLNYPEIRDHFSVNFKELSWNNYRYVYSVMGDSSFEIETSVIYTPKTFIPRSIKLNVTMSMFGMSVNFLEANLRLEGLDETFKAFIIDNLRSEQFLKRIMQKPEQLIELLNIVADKLRYTEESPKFSFGLRVYGSQVFYSKLDSTQEMRNFTDLFFRSPLDNLYRQMQVIKNVMLWNSRIKQPLMNGFEFETSLDVTAGLLVSKASTRQVQDVDTKFDLDNFYSFSLGVNRKYEVQINNANKLSLKKRSFVNGRLRMDMDGLRGNVSSIYNLNLRPVAEWPMLTMDGQFFKLTYSGSQMTYVPIENFKINQVKYQSCNTKVPLQSSLGVYMCLSVQRPETSMMESFRYLFVEDIERTMIDQEDEYEQSLDRPSLLLSGPYHYEVKLMNPDLIKTITLTMDKTKETGKMSYNLKLSTKNQNDQVKDTLNMFYLGERHLTNRGMTRKINMEVRRPETNELRFQFLYDFIYQQDEVLAGNIVIDNKFVNDLLVQFNFGRNKTQIKNIVPSYYMEAIFDNKFIQSRRYRLFSEIRPTGKSIKTDLVIEKIDVSSKFNTEKLVEMDLNMNYVQQSDPDMDYDIDMRIRTITNTDTRITGKVFATLLRSNISLAMTYTCPTYTLPQPATVRLGHMWSGETDAKNYFEMFVNLPSTPINFGERVLFNFDISTKRFNFIEFQLFRQEAMLGSLFYENRRGNRIDWSVGLRNWQIDLSKYQYLQPIIKNQNVLKSLVLSVLMKNETVDRKFSNEMSILLNDQELAAMRLNLQGDFKQLRTLTTEVPRSSVSGDLYMRVLDNIGTLSTELNFESSRQNDKHSFEFQFQTENFIQNLMRIKSIMSKMSSQKGKINANLQVFPVGEITSYQIGTTGDVMTQNDSQFAVEYVKVMQDGTNFKGTSAVKYTYKDFQNWEAALTVDGHFMYSMSLMNKRINTVDMFGNHLFKFANKHMDGKVQFENDIKLVFNNKTAENKFLIETSIISAPLDKLNDKTQRYVWLEYSTEYTMEMVRNMRTIVDTVRSLDFGSKTYNYYVTSNVKTSNSTSNSLLMIEAETSVKLPSINEPTVIRKMNHFLKYTRNTLNNEITMQNEFETDSKMIGKLVKKLNIDFNRHVDQKTVTGDLSIVHKTIDDVKDRTYKLTWDYDMKSKFNANLKQNVWTTASVFNNQQVYLTDCSFEGVLDRQNDSTKYLLDTKFTLKCSDKRISSNQWYVNIRRKDTYQPSSLIKYSMVSDLISFPESSWEFEQDFTRTIGMLRFDGKYNLTNWSNQFSYSRVLNLTTSQYESANYKWNIVNPRVNMQCNMNVERRTDFTQEIACRFLNSDWGYMLKLNNRFVPVDGKQRFQFDLTLPARKMRMIYNSVSLNLKGQYNGTLQFQWDLLRQPNKMMQFNFMNIMPVQGVRMPVEYYFLIEALNHPRFNMIRLEFNRTRTFNQTIIHPKFQYELDGLRNCIDILFTMSADMHTNAFSMEANMDRPQFNFRYANKYEKHTGQLQHLWVRMGKLVELNVDKESDPEQRRISLVFTNPDETVYVYEGQSTTTTDNIYVVNGKLRKNSQILSQIKSSFDSDNNHLVVELTGLSTGKTYKLDFGMYNETLANAYLMDVKANQVLGLVSLGVEMHDNHYDLVMKSRWNRMWSEIQNEIMAGQGMDKKVQKDDAFNSYIGDVYSSLSNDLKKSWDVIRQDRNNILNDLGLTRVFENSKTVDFNQTISYFKTYNMIASKLTEASLMVRTGSKFLSTYIPRFPTVAYNSLETKGFANNLVIRRPTLNARTLYQFNAEYRNYVKQIGDWVLFFKTMLIRDVNAMSVTGLYNKYKMRSLRDYTLVGNVFNRRNIIGFDGEQIVLQTKCTYLLAHETHKNRFSVVLNYNDYQYPITVYTYGQKRVDISYNKVAVDQKSVSFPQTLLFGDNGNMTITRLNTAVCVELNHDLRVCCYEDSQSCTIATTRWFTGKLNGILGNQNHNIERIQENLWFLEKSCNIQRMPVRTATNEVFEQCNTLFGNSRYSMIGSTIMAIEQSGWQRMCETALNADPKATCLLLKAFEHFVDQQNIRFEAPNYCYSCNLKSTKYLVGQTVNKMESTSVGNFENGSDFVFLTVGCDNTQYFDGRSFFEAIKSRNPLNRYYAVSADLSSIYQSSTGEVFNFDLKEARETLFNNLTSPCKLNWMTCKDNSWSCQEAMSCHRKQIENSLHLAASLFSRRLAKTRNLIIRSCVSVNGNRYLPYDMIETIKQFKFLSQNNIVVHSWSNYEMTDLEKQDHTDETPIGYNDEEIYMYKSGEQKIETDNLYSYKIEHDADLWQRFAVTTKGTVMNTRYLSQPKVLSQFTDMFLQRLDKLEYTYELRQCEKIESCHGDATDFSYRRIRINKDE